MLLNPVEWMLVNNPFRVLLERHLEAPRLLRMGGTIEGQRALEVGCGRGIGVETVLDRFAAARVDAFDLDGRMLTRARDRLRGRRDRVNLWQGDACAIPVADSSYDAVFDFEIIHHIPDWRRAVAETYRVLRPGGRLFAGEVPAKFILNPVIRRLLKHPEEERFDEAQFVAAIRAAGFRVVATSRIGGYFAWVVEDRPRAVS